MKAKSYEVYCDVYQFDTILNYDKRNFEIMISHPTLSRALAIMIFVTAAFGNEFEIIYLRKLV
ncbi:MAG: hypothetical protein CL831_02040 [Crocinitomicaceae bacterium]|nr:hypothetical protein [Crocinitomicaceae bacterium]